jgi:preprotein translocase subunit SecE
VSDLAKIGIWAAVIGTIFVVLWQKGYVRKITDYWNQTWEELKKCSWPTWEELKGSTVIVVISVFILGLFTVGVDFVFVQVFGILHL